MRSLWMIWTMGSVLAVTMIFTHSAAQEQKKWTVGPYSFSDEMGGFSIRSVTGTGTTEDPIVITEELNDIVPVTLVIRNASVGQPGFAPKGFGLLFHLQIRAVNGSGRPWQEFFFELQSLLGEPSDYSDGLSFCQPCDLTGMIHSNLFAAYDDDFEPYDRMLFHDGKVDPKANVTMDFPIGDFTPKRIFYLVQEPRIPST
ncbi:hypothetical protein ACTJJ7_14480 [Phyllobacterium sp. 22229]|uniref:hypothetical protein n=1 Tax=Phyllobacterium sp. 22229 TaxID=3453895 RepID=UPI003F86F861